MKKRQEELVEEIISKFEKLNDAKSFKGSILDLDKLIGDQEESDAIRKEIEICNEALMKELRRNFQEKCEELSKDLNILNVPNSFKDNEKRIFIIGDSYTNKAINLEIKSEIIRLPNNENVCKYVSEQLSMGNVNTNSFEKMIESNLFQQTIKRYIDKFYKKE